MDTKKLILSIIGIAALAIPVVLLIIFTNRSEKQPEVSVQDRQIDPQTVRDVVRKIPTPEPVILPSPSPASPSAEEEQEGSPSAE